MDLTTMLRKLRRSIASFAVVAIIASLSVASAVSAFSDVKESDWYYSNVQTLVDAGVLDGTKDKFNGGANLNRAEAAKIAVMAAGVAEEDLVNSETPSFSDVPKSLWAYKYVETAKSLGFVSGDAGKKTFRPGDNVNRAEYAKMMSLALELEENTAGGPHFKDVKSTDWFYAVVETAYNWSVVNGYEGGMFKPSAAINRAEMSKMTVAAMDPVAREATPTPTPTPAPGVDCKVTPDAVGCKVTPPAPVASGVTVTLASDSPSTTSILADGTNGGQALAALSKFNFTASNDGDVKITTVKLHKLGVLNDTNFLNVYLYDGGTRLAEMTSISNGVITFTGSTAAPLFTVTKGTVKGVTVLVDVNKSASGSSGIQMGTGLASADDIATDGAKVSGSFPASGSLMTVASVTDLGKLTVANVSPTTTGNVDPQDNYDLWKFSLQASNQNVSVSKLAFTNIGSVNASDVVNFKLYDGGTQIGTAVASVDAEKRLVFDMTATPLLITSGITKQISLKGDIKSGSTRSYQFSLQKSSDITVKDTQYNIMLFPFPSGGTVGTWAVVKAGGATTINGGTISVSKTTDSPSGNIAKNGTNVTLARYELKASGEDIKVTSLNARAIVGAAASGKTIKNLKLYKLETGSTAASQVGTTQSSVISSAAQAITSGTADANDVSFTLGNSLTVPAGKSTFVTLVGDITGTAVATDAVQVALVQGSSNGQGVLSLSSANVPSATSAANSLVVASGSLAGAKNSSVASMTVVNGAQQQLVGSIILSAGAAEGIDLTSLTLTDVDATEGLGVALNNIKLMSGTTQLGQTSVNPGVTAGATVTFNVTPSLAIAAGASVQVDVYADILSSASTGWTGAADSIKVSAASGVGKSTTTTISLGSAANLQQVTAATGGTVTISLDPSTTQDQQVVMNSTANTYGVWKIAANNAENLNVNQLIFIDNSPGQTSVNNVKNLKLYANGVQVGNTVSGLSNVTNTTNTVVTLGAATTTIKLGADASATTDFYNNYYIVFLTNSTIGNDIGKVGLVTAYNGTTKVATITPVGAAFTNEDHAGATYKIISGAVFSGINTAVTANNNKLFTLKGDVSDFTNATVGLKNRFTLNTLGSITGAGTDSVVVSGASSGAYATLANTNTAYAGNNSYAYRTKFTASLNSASPSGTGKTRTANDVVLKLDAKADAGYETRMRAAYSAAGFAAGDLVGALDGSKSAVTVTAAGGADCNAGATVGSATGGPGAFAPDGILCTAAAGGASATVTFTLSANQDLTQASAVSIFVKESNVVATTFNMIDTGVTTGATAVTPVAGQWQQIILPINSLASASKDVVSSFSITTANSAGAGNTFAYAGLQILYDYAKVNLTASANMVSGKLITLRNDNNSTTVASGVSSITTASTTGFVVFAPTQAQGDFVISAGQTLPLSLVTDTTSLLTGTASLSTYITLGSSSAGSVTNGDVWWYDGSAIAAGSSGSVTWVNSTPTTLQGNSLSYS